MAALSPTDWQRAKAIIADALDIAPEARADWLLVALVDVPHLRETVESLLAEATGESDGDSGSDAFLSRPVSATFALTPSLPSPGTLIGAWRVVREIGRGGMGVIFLAERADGAYQQKVALKLLRSTQNRDAARMARERQTLASVQHPNIARLIDGGDTPEGIPYLVLEYVEGETIDAWCESQALSVTARVALVEKVAAAVQSAHQQLVVHRDIKPSNVVVGIDGEPKLLDFGIARLLESRDAGVTTQDGGLLFTPRYASPEQVNGLPVTVATDVYGLGALLYMLLANAGPYPRLTSTDATNVAAVMRIVAEDPLAPASEMAAQSRPAFAEELKGDLDLILAKACARDVAMRYATVAALAADLSRWRAGNPISARAPTLAYTARKFVGRHKAGTVLACIALVAIGVGALGTWVQKREAERQYAKSRQIINTFIFKYYDALAPLSQTLSIRKDLVNDGLKYLDELKVADNDFSGQLERGVGYLKLGNSLFNGRNLAHLGDRTGGDAAAAKARTALGLALSVEPGASKAEAALAKLAMRDADILWQDRKTTDAAVLYRRLADDIGKIRVRDASDLDLAGLQPYALLQVAIAENRAGQNVDALVARARQTTDAFVQQHPGTNEAMSAVGLLLQREIVLASDRKDWAAATTASREAVRQLEADLPRRTDRIDAIRVLQSVYNNFAFNAANAREFDGAIEAGRKAVEWAEVIMREELDSADATYKLGAAEYALARAAFKSKQNDDLALTYAERAVGTFEALAKRDLTINQQRHYAVTIELWWDAMNQGKQLSKKSSIRNAMARYAAQFPEAIKTEPIRNIYNTIVLVL